jgi:osmoprotectant transport system permease protein
MTLAFLGQLGDAVQFIFTKSEGPGGAQVGGSQLLPLLREHLLITFVSVGIATAIALPLGTWLGHSRRGSFLVVSVTNAGRAVPSLGVVFLFFAVLGAGFFNITLALVLLAIPPILLNAYAGVRAVDP